MKKIFVTLAISLVIIACNSGEDKKADEKAPEATATAAAEDENKYTKGIELIGGSDCLTCHKVDEKLTGPSYRDVANKYEATDANIDMLAKKIIEGGAGNWGPVAMTPHPTTSEDDAKEMVRYILSLKNK
jgi:cytochrome c